MHHVIFVFPEKKTRDIAIAFIIIVLSSLLVFPNLGKTCLWDDEAQTAIVAGNILTTGLPTAAVDKSFVSILPDHSDVRNGIYIWQPWLPNYLVAGSMAIFGRNSFGARFPFALAFVMLVTVSYFFFNKFDQKRNNLSLITVILLVSCIPLLLHSRQCRYYILVPLLNILIVKEYLRFMAEPKLKYIAGITIWATALYNTFPPGAILLCLALGIDFIRKMPNRKTLQLASAGLFLCIIINLPVFVFCRMWDRQYGVQPGYSGLHVFGMYLLRYITTINNYFFPVFVIFIAGLFNWKRIIQCSRNKINDEIILFIIICVTQIIGFSVLSDYPFTRYLIGIVPFILFLGAGCILSISAKRQWLSWIIVFIIVSTNITNLLPLSLMRGSDLKNAEWTSAGIDSQFLQAGNVGFSFARGEVGQLIRMAPGYPLLDYIKSIVNPPQGPIDVIVNYLNKEASPNDRVKISYGDLPLMFHTKQFITSSTEVGPPAPEWLIYRHFNPMTEDAEFARITRNYNYTTVELPVGDVQWNNQPDSLYHFYATPTIEMAPFVKILRRSGPALRHVPEFRANL